MGMALLLVREAKVHRQAVRGRSVLLGLGSELDSMAEKETMAPKITATEKIVPFSIGTLDTKSIGLSTSMRACMSAYLLHAAPIKTFGTSMNACTRRWAIEAGAACGRRAE